MREFTQRLSGEDLTRGLQPTSLGFGSTHMVELVNLRPDPEGLRGYSRVEDPFDGGYSINYPFPQVVEATDSLYLFDEEKVYTVSEGFPWMISEENTVNSRDPAAQEPKDIPAGGWWDVAQAQNSWYAVNGNGVVWKAGRGKQPGSDEPVQVDDLMQPMTAAYHKGRYFMGGFTGTFWSGKMSDVMSYWEYDTYVQDIENVDLGNNWIFWSSIGGADFPAWFLSLSENWPRNQPNNTDRLAEAFKQNEIGMMPLDVDGTVLGLEPLGDNLIAYCDEAVFLLQLTFPGSQEVPSTVGQQKISDAGVASRGAFGGTQFRQLYIDQLGRLHRVNADGEDENLSYKIQFEDYIDETTRIFYEQSDQDWYISFESAAFLLTTQGLCEITESPTFLINRADTVYGLSKKHGDETARLVGAPTDLSDRGRKTVTSVAVAHRGDSQVKGGYQTKATVRDDGWNTAQLQLVNDNGIAYVRKTGESFRPVIEIKEPQKTEVDYIEYRFQLPDKRHQRGPRAGSIDS